MTEPDRPPPPPHGAPDTEPTLQGSPEATLPAAGRAEPTRVDGATPGGAGPEEGSRESGRLEVTRAAPEGLRPSAAPTARAAPAPALASAPSLARSSPSAPALVPAGEPFGRYRLLRELGRGGMGVVYEAWDGDLERRVALKTLLPEAASTPQAVERFLREARAAARLRHPHIVPVHAIGSFAGRHFFTMDFIAGSSLEAAKSRLSLRRFLEILRDTARALGAAHAAGIVHRDVKPANILLDAADAAYVGDFGLAKEISESADRRLTASGAAVGTPHFMAPEQAQGRADQVGPATDVWSLGVMLYERLAGRLPFEAVSYVDLLMSIVHAEPLSPARASASAAPLPSASGGTAGAQPAPGRAPRVHPDLETVCLRCLEKEPRRRYASGSEVADELDRFLAGEPITARPPSRYERVRRWVGRRRAVTAAVVAGVLLAGGTGGIAWRAALESAAARRPLLESALVREVQGPLAEAIGARRGGDVKLLERVGAAAVARADALLAREPELAEAHYLKGWLARLLGRLEEAERELSRAAAARPRDAATHYPRGLGRIARQRELARAARRAAAERRRAEAAWR
ncbi:MAG: serine/threonine protein kinase, partial [Planctomycetes bacterium]|nr:serine/threonine protein kinase [Planctomycetota bacterium]